MNYSETVDYLYTQLPMFSRIGSAAFKKDLTNTLLLCEHLGNPHKKFKSIHIGGTNGKGSVSHMLAAIFQTSGYKTGLYTSPHLYDFRERIKINGVEVNEEFVIEFVEKILPVINQIHPSFFEITVAMAFDYFALQKVDVAIIEVGLGGRLDSTNIITPELSIITNIGWDHMNMLGNTLQEIAGEKAGIIKEKIPVVVGESLPETKNVFSNAASVKNAPIYFSEYVFSSTNYYWEHNYLIVDVAEKSTKESKSYASDLPGVYQVKNICTVLSAINEIRKIKYEIPDTAIYDGLKNVKKITGLHGRWEVINENPTVVLEVAHNEDGIQQMLAHLQNIEFRKLHIVFGVVKDKEVDAILKMLPKNASYYFTQSNIPRALPAEELKTKAAIHNLVGSTFENVNDALSRAKERASKDDLILVCGSIFLVAEVKRQ